MSEELELIADVKAAFQNCQLPSGRIIDPRVDLSYNIEARHVEDYMQKNRNIVDRHNSVLVAFHYLTPEAALAMLPFYFLSIIENFDDGDFILDIILDGLASRNKLQGAAGVEIRELASEQQARAVCRFCRWLLARSWRPDPDEVGHAALELWCTLIK